MGRVDCTYDHEVCDLFVNHVNESKHTYPLVLMVTEDHMFIYDKPIIADNIIKDFISNEQYKNYKIHGGNKTATSKVLR